MMSSSQIVAMSRRAARESACAGVTPLIVEAEDLKDDGILHYHLRHIPFIGDRTPRGWRLLHAANLLGSDRNCVPWHGDEKHAYRYMQVDSSGFGAEDEPSFTHKGFLEAVHAIGPGKAYAIVEAGQFQVVVGVFERITH